MSYVVVPSRTVTLFLDRAGTPTRSQFLQIVELLEDDPFPGAGFPAISERTALMRRPFFRYYDEVFPYFLDYRVYPLDSSVGGIVLLADIALPYDEIAPS